MVQRFAPKLIATLDRAIAFLQSTLAYGRASETAPMRRLTDLRLLAEDSAGIAGADVTGSGESQNAALVNAVPQDFAVHVDPDQMARVLSNLIRNAVQALEQAGTESPRVTVAAARLMSDVVIDVVDNGPGVPARAREHLFEAFRGGARAGGTGLGLAIAAELVRLHGGRIELLPSARGAAFRITLPELPPQA
jgi:signal transduction histidine kinase